MRTFDLLLDKLHLGKNPYDCFPVAQWAGTWYEDPGAKRKIFSKVIEQISPALIVEVGSFVGESAIHMAKLIKAKKIDAAILCVDTWYAGLDHWKGARDKIQMHFGRPDFYYKFVSNVISHDCHHIIVPFAMDSVGAARVIKWLGIVPQMVYIDASHEQGDVYRDFEAYWDLLPKEGVMLVDDLTKHFPGVLADWDRFCSTFNVKPVATEGEKAFVIKP